MKHALLLTLFLAACDSPQEHDITPQAGAAAQALAAAQPCYTAQVSAVKTKLQGPPYYCKAAAWTYDIWNLRNSDCSSTSAYSLWMPMGRGNGQSTCSYTINRLDDDNDPPGYCRWKAGTVSSSNVVTITNYAGSCW